jgi:hypothetical protein
MHKKYMQIKETPYGYPSMHKKHVKIKETPYGYPSMHKKHVKIKETPYGYPSMHKKYVQIKETPYGYPSMHKKHVQIKERRRAYGNLWFGNYGAAFCRVNLGEGAYTLRRAGKALQRKNALAKVNDLYHITQTLRERLISESEWSRYIPGRTGGILWPLQ